MGGGFGRAPIGPGASFASAAAEIAAAEDAAINTSPSCEIADDLTAWPV